MLRLVCGRDYSFPKSLCVPCAWAQSPKSVSLRDVVRDVAHEGGSTAWDQFTHIKLESGIHFPNQPNHSPCSIVSDPPTYWSGVILCPPEWSDVSLSESVVIAMITAAIREMTTNVEPQEPSMETILDFEGLRMESSLESTPHSDTQAYTSTYEAAELTQDLKKALRRTSRLADHWPENRQVLRHR